MTKTQFRATQRPRHDFHESTIAPSGLVNFPEGVKAFYGRQKLLPTHLALQALVFDGAIWTESKVKTWLKGHGYKTKLEPVSREEIAKQTLEAIIAQDKKKVGSANKREQTQTQKKAPTKKLGKPKPKKRSKSKKLRSKKS